MNKDGIKLESVVKLSSHPKKQISYDETDRIETSYHSYEEVEYSITSFLMKRKVVAIQIIFINGEEVFYKLGE